MKNIRIVVLSLVLLMGIGAPLQGILAEESSSATPPLLNINTADATTISASLTGVGLKKAQAIVVYREQYGEFKTLHELTEVKGIGPGIVSKNEQAIVFE